MVIIYLHHTIHQNMIMHRHIIIDIHLHMIITDIIIHHNSLIYINHMYQQDKTLIYNHQNTFIIYTLLIIIMQIISLQNHYLIIMLKKNFLINYLKNHLPKIIIQQKSWLNSKLNYHLYNPD